MEELYKNSNGAKLFVGDDSDFHRAKDKGFRIISACKEGDHGHRSILKYTSQGAPKGPNYLIANEGKHTALNLIDPDDPHLIPLELIEKAIHLIKQYLESGDSVLLHCNQGKSRSPAIAFLFLKHIKDLPESHKSAIKMFRTIYPKYKPGLGFETFVRKHYKTI